MATDSNKFIFALEHFVRDICCEARDLDVLINLNEGVERQINRVGSLDYEQLNGQRVMLLRSRREQRHLTLEQHVLTSTNGGGHPIGQQLDH